VAEGAATVDTVSDVLKAMNVPTEFALGTLRISFGRHSTMKDIDRATDILAETVLDYWKERGLP
jgi:cysteine desulfurase